MSSQKKNKFSIRKRLKSFGYAIQGIRTIISTQHNFRIHIFVAIVVVICGFYFSISKTEWCFSLLSIGLVISMEAVNTSIEILVDLVSPEHHPLAGKVKDAAAAAVLLSAIIAVVTGCVIFLPKFYGFFAAIA